MSTRDSLLPSNALSNVRLGISVSESTDLARLGLLEIHFRLALGEIARCVLVSGGRLAYGGHLEPGGYTVFLVRELERYARRDRPLRICLAWTEHRKMTVAKLLEEKDNLGLFGEIVCLDPEGKVVDPAANRPEGQVPEPDEAVRRKSLTGLRRYMTEHTQGRILIGGKREGFQGEMPGVLEEVLLSFQAKKPVYLAGGFGGVTSDIAQAIGIDDGTWLPKVADARLADRRVAQGIARLVEVAKTTGGASLDNGLTVKENRRLAVCHRPSEIATLVSLGLGQRFSRKGNAK